MKIIKQGDESRLYRPKMFECPQCGCIVEADNREYRYDEGQLEDICWCTCPTCSGKMYVKKGYGKYSQFE